ncbi:MAG: ATP-grasp domain-containing protein [Pseudomonadales bacterium]|nr:ATP-grasp domain-containing protein [Pseudomonadales bacterium]
MQKILIANRGEIAIRIIQAASQLGIETAAVFPEDDANSLHCVKADSAHQLKGLGPAAYLDAQQIISLARRENCDGIHPGYGFLSENAEFAKLCKDNNIIFIGPDAEHLSVFGDKTQARILAASCSVPLVPGTNGDTSFDEALSFFDALPKGSKALIKAVSGGGGRGMRIVEKRAELEEAYKRCKSEACSAFGNDAVYIEQLIPYARHIEIQIIGDGVNVTHLWDRECSIQRNHQKILEVAPSPSLTIKQREQLIEASLKMAKQAKYKSLGTFEFLTENENFYFIEANPRLQVEHTVTEAVTNFDLVQTQIKIAEGKTLPDLNIPTEEPLGFAIQCRVNMESISGSAKFIPTSGRINVFEPPSGKSVRVDHFAYSGYLSSARYDALLAKVIVHSKSSYADAIKLSYRALSEFRLEGFESNIPFLQSLLQHPKFQENKIYTRFVDDYLADLAEGIQHNKLFINNHSSEAQSISKDEASVPPGSIAVKSPLQGTIISLSATTGAIVDKGDQIAVMEAMKMEHVIEAPASGEITSIVASLNNAMGKAETILVIKTSADSDVVTEAEVEIDLSIIRPDLQEALDRTALGQDISRPEAVKKRRNTGHRTARENILDIVDEDSYIEYGALAIAAQRRRRTVDDLMQNTAADGMVTGIGSVNQKLFPHQDTQCVVMSYDYMVLAGTQGLQNHRKKDRMFEIAIKNKLPVILIAEGGGGRPGDTDGAGIAGLDCLAFQLWGELCGLVPRIGITTGRCFAGNAALLGASDVIIATEGSNIGMGGPAMIEGGGLGVFTPDEVGPMSDQVPNGVVDIAVKDEAEAVHVAKKYLSYFQGSLETYTYQDQRKLRNIIPENRLRIYDVRKVIKTLADDESVLEIRSEFALGMITAFARIEGRPVGILANNPSHLSGAIDSNCADKAARFLQLCDAFDIPILSLCDTPGIMVGPEVEKTALVRHAARMFVIGASLSVPYLTIVLRKGYGLGAQAMAGGGFKAGMFTITWPTGEFGGMGLEGAVKLGYRKELEAIEDPTKREEAFQARVDNMYQRGKAVNYATAFEIDGVIDPVDSRKWIVAALKSSPKAETRDGKKRGFIDTW